MSNKPAKIGTGDRVVDPRTGERGKVIGFQEPNLPWHEGGCPIVEPDDPSAGQRMGRYWHHAVLESEAKTCGTCAGVMFTPTCTHDKHVEARLVERIVDHLRDEYSQNKHARDFADLIATKFHPASPLKS